MLQLALLLLSLGIGRAEVQVGGFKSQPGLQNDLHVQEVARFAVQQLAAIEDESLELANILSVKTQVVAGTNYEIELMLTNGQVFDLTVFESLNGKDKRLMATKQLPGRSLGASAPLAAGSGSKSSEQRGRQAQSPVSDGYKTVKMPMLDDGTMFAARETVQYLSQSSNSLYPFTVGEIISAAVRQEGQDESTYVVRVRIDQRSLPSATVDAQVSRSNMNTYKVLQVTKPRYSSDNNSS